MNGSRASVVSEIPSKNIDNGTAFTNVAYIEENGAIKVIQCPGNKDIFLFGNNLAT